MPDKWLCDKCETASFFTFEEALKHEETCEKRQEDEIDGWLCEKCKTATFATFEETVEHEKKCRGIQGRKVMRITKNKSIQKSIILDTWLCDVCKKSFFSFEEASKHEEHCEERQENDGVDGWSYIIT